MRWDVYFISLYSLFNQYIKIQFNRFASWLFFKLTTSFAIVLHRSPFLITKPRRNVAPKLPPPVVLLLQTLPPNLGFRIRVSETIVLAWAGEEVRGVVGQRRLRQIGPRQFGFSMDSRRLPHLPQPKPQSHCLWRCSHPLLNRFTFHAHYPIQYSSHFVLSYN